MKTVLVVIFLGITFASASTNPPPTLVTNLVTAHPDFRRVNGQLYNITKSQLWEAHDLEFIRATNNVVLAKHIKYTPIYEEIRHPGTRPDPLVASGNFLGSNPRGANYGPRIEKKLIRTDREVIGELAITNCLEKSLRSKELFSATAMKVGEVTIGRKTYELWDQGLPNTVAVITTNSPSAKR